MENLVLNAKKKISLNRFITSIKISSQNEIKEVLDVNARTVLGQVEQANNVLTYSGRVVVNAICVGKDNQVFSADASVDFIEKQQVLVALSSMVASDNVMVNIDTFSSTEILCSITHNTDIYGVYSYEIADFVGENTAFVLNKKSFTSKAIITSQEDNFVVAEECESNIMNMQILSSKSEVISTECVASVDKVVVEGKIQTETIYYDGETVGTIVKEFEFKQEVSANAVLPNMSAEAIVIVKNTTVTDEVKQDKTNLVYALDVYAKIYVYDENNYEIATDMFSLDSEIQNTYDYLEVKNYVEPKKISDVVMSSTIVSNIPDFDDIIGVYMPKVTIKEIVEQDAKSIILAEVSAFALYKSGENIKRLDVIHETKFEVQKEAEEIADGAKIYAQISSFKVKAGKELEVAFKIEGSVDFSNMVSNSFVKSFEIKAEKPQSEGGIKVYVASKGETIFDVARVLSVRPETILEQNEVDGVFEQGEKIYVYSPINIM